MNSSKVGFLMGIPSDPMNYDPLSLAFKRAGSYLEIYDYGTKTELDDLVDGIATWIEMNNLKKIVAYSWGAYILLKALEKRPNIQVDLFLVNPYVFSKQAKIGIKHKIIMNQKFMSIILKLFSKKITHGFIAKTFDPEDSDDFRDQLFKSWNDPKKWFYALCRKTLMELHPVKQHHLLKDSHKVEVMCGKLDQSAPVQSHVSFLQNVLKDGSVVMFEKMGHSLPWSKPQSIVKKVVESFR